MDFICQSSREMAGTLTTPNLTDEKFTPEDELEQEGRDGCCRPVGPVPGGVKREVRVLGLTLFHNQSTTSVLLSGPSQVFQTLTSETINREPRFFCPCQV